MKKKYFPYLDGMRAVSILLVVLYHAWLPVFKGGFIGVDIFFVISGYLVTSLLIKEGEENGHISLKNFYLRRIFRIFPGLLTLISVAALGSIFLPSILGTDINRTLTAAYGMHINFFTFTGNNAGGLGHLWSVHLEEQFYFSWPIILSLFVFRFNQSPKRLIPILAFIVLSAFLLRLDLNIVPNQPPWLRFFLNNRIDHLLLGCLFGLMSVGKLSMEKSMKDGSTIQHLINWALFGTLLAVSQLHEEHFGAIPYASISVSAGLLIVRLKDSPSSLLKELLSSKFLVYIGKRSYSIYLWHWLVQVVVVKAGFTGTAKAALYVTLSILLSEASYRLIEMPFLRIKERFSV